MFFLILSKTRVEGEGHWSQRALFEPILASLVSLMDLIRKRVRVNILLNQKSDNVS